MTNKTIEESRKEVAQMLAAAFELQKEVAKASKDFKDTQTMNAIKGLVAGLDQSKARSLDSNIYNGGSVVTVAPKHKFNTTPPAKGSGEMKKKANLVKKDMGAVEGKDKAGKPIIKETPAPTDLMDMTADQVKALGADGIAAFGSEKIKDFAQAIGADMGRKSNPKQLAVALLAFLDNPAAPIMDTTPTIEDETEAAIDDVMNDVDALLGE